MGSGKLFTVSAFSQLSLAGSSSQRPAVPCWIWARAGAPAAGTAGARGAPACATAGGRGDGATFGATAGARGDCTLAADGANGASGAAGTGGAARGGLGAFGTVGDDAAGGLTDPAARAGAAPGRASRDSLTSPASLIPASHANGDDAESATAPLAAAFLLLLPTFRVRRRRSCLTTARALLCALHGDDSSGARAGQRHARCLKSDAAPELPMLVAVKT